MDVLYFLRGRTRIIRSYHATAAAPFQEILNKIEAGEPPYEPPYSENGEPPFMAEWMEAQTALDLLGLSCISMLSDSLKLYFREWERELGIECQPALKKEFRNGFLHGYRTCFAQAAGVKWDECPADLAIIEQVVLARNRAQHPDSIIQMTVSHPLGNVRKHPQPFFVSDLERELLTENDIEDVSWIYPFVKVDRDTLLGAIAEVEKLCDWLEVRLLEAIYGPRHAR